MNKHNVLKIFSAAFCTVYTAGFIADRFPTVTRYEIKTSKKGIGRIRIVNVSDIHNNSFGRGQSRLLEILRELAPDIIVSTGDIAENYGAENAYAFIRGAAELAPVYYCTGNHDYKIHYYRFKRLMEELSEAGAIILRNETVRIKRGENEINLIGIDDMNLKGNALNYLCGLSDSSLFTAALAHQPQYFGRYAKANCDLVLCGHAHGGQIRLPFGGGVFSPQQGFFPKYAEGIHTKNGTSMIVSRGMGNHVPCPRFFNPPEVVSVDIVFEKNIVGIKPDL